MFDSWFVLAVATAVVYGGQAAYLKGWTDHVEQWLVTWSIWLFALPFFAVALAYQGVPTVEAGFWLPCFVSLGVNLVAWPAFVRAVRVSDISLVMPLLAFTPVFILGVEFALLGTAPGWTGAVGIALVVLGAYVLNVRAGFSALLDPVRALVSDRGARWMMFVAVIWSVSATVEKLTVTHSSPTFYLTVFGGMFALFFVPVMKWFGEVRIRDVADDFGVLAGAGALTAAMALVQMAAIRTTPLVNYVIAIKRAGMVVSVLLGWWLFGEENIGFRLAGAVVMVAGVAVIRMA